MANQPGKAHLLPSHATKIRTAFFEIRGEGGLTISSEQSEPYSSDKNEPSKELNPLTILVLSLSGTLAGTGILFGLLLRILKSRKPKQETG